MNEQHRDGSDNIQESSILLNHYIDLENNSVV